MDVKSPKKISQQSIQDTPGTEKVFNQDNVSFIKKNKVQRTNSLEKFKSPEKELPLKKTSTLV